jgi:hypothetical protein
MLFSGVPGEFFRGRATGSPMPGEFFRGRAAEGHHGERVYVRPQSLRPPLMSRGEISHAIPLKACHIMNSNR